MALPVYRDIVAKDLWQTVYRDIVAKDLLEFKQ